MIGSVPCATLCWRSFWFNDEKRWNTIGLWWNTRISAFPVYNIDSISDLQTNSNQSRGAIDSAKNHKRQRRKRQSVTAKGEKSQTP